MKKLLVLACTIGALYSCKKPIDDGTPLPTPVTPSVTLEKSFRVADHQVTPGDSNNVLFEHIARVKAIPGCVFTMGRIDFTATDGLSLSAVKNIVVTIKDATGVLWHQTIASVATPTVEFQLNLNLVSETTVDTIQVSADIPDGLVHGKLTAKVGIEYWSQATSLNRTNLTDAQVVTVDAPRLLVAISSSTPPSKLILGGTENTMIEFSVTAQGGDIPLDAFTFTTLNPAMVEALHIYEGAANIASTSSLSGTTTVTMPTGYVVTNGTTRTLQSRLLTKLVTSLIEDRKNLKTTLTSVKYRLPNGDIRTATVSLAGNDQYLVKSYLRITRHPITQSLQNGAQRELLRFTVEAIGGPISWKAIPNNILWGDQIDNNALAVKSLHWWKNDINATSLVKFYNEDGREDSVYSESNSRLTVAWITEDIVMPGAPVTYTLKGAADGFGPGNGDALQLSAAADPISSIWYSKLTLGSVLSNQTPKLADVSGAVQEFSIIWSDLSAGIGVGHSANGALGSSDWFSGAYTDGEEYTHTLTHP